MDFRVGVVVPCYNEAENIVSLIEAIRQQIPESAVLVVDDSPDLATVEAVRALAWPGVDVLHRDAKGGRGSAVLVGLARLLEEGCDHLVEMDADFSHDPRQLPDLLAHGRQVDLVIGSRYLPGSRIVNWPRSRRLFSRTANFVARLLLGVPMTDYTNGYRVYSRRAAECVSATCGRLGAGFIALSEILVNLYYRGYSVSEIPTVFVNRVRGESSLSRREIGEAFMGLLKIFRLRLHLGRRRTLSTKP